MFDVLDFGLCPAEDKQDRLLQNVEQHFMTGLRRADGRTVGLGL